MKLNKTVAKTMVFALGLGAFSLFGGYTTKAATAPAAPAPGDLEFKVSTESITTKGANAKYWGIAKVEKNSEKADIKVNTDSYKVTEVYPVLENYIDLSSLSKSKEIIIAVGSTPTPSGTTWIVKKIPAAVKDFAFEYVTKYDAGKKVKGANDSQALGDVELGYFIAAKKDTILPLEAEHTNIEVQEGDAPWVSLLKFLGDAATDAKAKEKLSNFVQTGKTLKFRLKADNSWNSNEVTVKIPSLPNAPKIKIDPTKGTVSMKEGMQYKRKGDNSGITDDSYKDATNKMTLTDLEAYKDKGLGINGGSVTVRTKAKGNKLPSKEATYIFKKQDKPTVADVAENSQSVELIGTDVVAALKVRYDLKKGAILTNKSDKNYEYFLSRSGAEPTTDTKWKKLPAAKTKKGGKKVETKINLKYSENDKIDTFGGENTKIYLRLAGIKQEGNTVTLASKEDPGNFVFKPIAQAFTVDGGTPETSTHTATVGKETIKKITFKVSNIQDSKKSVKIKVTSRVNGISVKASKLKAAGSGSHTFDVTIKVSKSAFKDVSAGNKLVFNLSLENAKVEHTCTISATK